MAGVLSFTLGLEASNFLRNIGLASGQIISLASAGRALEAVMDNVWSAIERGGALTDLSNRTGESVGHLYQLQEAFDVVGLGAESVGPMLTRLQKAMSGVDETGQRTDKVFAALGLNLDKLKKLDAPKQFELIAGALEKLDQNQAIGISSALFGREGAGAFLQLTRDFQGFQQSFKDSAEAAAVFARSAAAFDQIGDTLTTIKMKLGGLWAGVAEGAAPAIQAVEDFVNTFDFVKVGQEIGRVFTAITQAFREGSVGELLAVSIDTGIQVGFAVLPGLLAKMGQLLVDTVSTAIALGIEVAARNPLLRETLKMVTGGTSEIGFGALGFNKPPPQDPFAFLKGNNPDELLKTGIENAIEAAKPLMELIEQLNQRAPKVPGKEEKPNSTNDVSGALQSGSKPNVSALEKIGLVIGNGSDKSDTRRTAQNTEQMVALAKTQIEVLKNLPSLFGGSAFRNL